MIFLEVLFIKHIPFTFVDNKQQIMQSKKQTLLPKFHKIFDQIRENIKLARKRRNLTTIQVAERTGLDRSTLYHMEKEIQAFLWVLIIMFLGY